MGGRGARATPGRLALGPADEEYRVNGKCEGHCPRAPRNGEPEPSLVTPGSTRGPAFLPCNLAKAAGPRIKSGVTGNSEAPLPDPPHRLRRGGRRSRRQDPHLVLAAARGARHRGPGGAWLRAARQRLRGQRLRRRSRTGLWRDTPEWGLCYTMVMTEACRHVADVHDRMPVLLRRRDWTDWLDGAPDAAGLLCRPYPELMVVERTAERWVRR